MKRVLVITCKADAHADIICPKIEQTGSPVVRLNTDELRRYEVGITLGMRPQSLLIRDLELNVETTSEQIGSVWFRRPIADKSLDSMMDDESIRFIRAETKEFMKSITMVLPHAFWVTAPWVLYRSRLKTAQLQIASELGLKIPRTIVTRDNTLVRDFFRECDGKLIAKTIKLQYIETEDAYYTFRTQAISEADLEDQNLYLSPTVYQEMIDTEYEIRVVAIGRRLYPFKLKVKDRDQTIIDLKAQDQEKIDTSSCVIPTELEKKIISLLDYLSLPFSSMDFLVDKKERMYFVDLNPNGQWLWLEELTGVVMSDEFARMLVDRRIPA